MKHRPSLFLIIIFLSLIASTHLKSVPRPMFEEEEATVDGKNANCPRNPNVENRTEVTRREETSLAFFSATEEREENRQLQPEKQEDEPLSSNSTASLEKSLLRSEQQQLIALKKKRLLALKACRDRQLSDRNHNMIEGPSSALGSSSPLAPTSTTEANQREETSLPQQGMMAGISIQEGQPHPLVETTAFTDIIATLRKTPPLEKGNISDVTHSSPDSATTTEDRDLLDRVTEAYDRSELLAKKSSMELRLHPDKNQRSDLLPVYHEVRTLVEEVVSLARALPSTAPDREAMVTQAARTALNALVIASYSSTKGEKESYSDESDAFHNVQDTRWARSFLSDAKKLLDYEKTPDDMIGIALLAMQQKRLSQMERHASSNHIRCNKKGPYFSNSQKLFNIFMVAQENAASARSKLPIDDPVEARQAAIDDVLTLITSGLEIADRTMRYQGSSSL